MSDNPITKNIISILAKIEENGFEAYAVGGCVRDIILGKKPSDWDITTSARPEDIMAIFERSAPTGAAFGTVTVFYRNTKAEITTFRAEAGYSDLRRPDSVKYVSSLKEDLSRRDLTINAIAMDKEGRIIDLNGGIADITAGIIRCVGRAEDRFSEDALRMLRAVRFSAKLGFTIGENELRAIKKLSYKAEKLSAERVRDEIVKILLSQRPQKIGDLIEFGLLKKYIDFEAPLDLSPLSKVKATLPYRISAFLAVLKIAGYSDGLLLKKLRFSVRCEKLCAGASELGSKPPSGDRILVKKYLNVYGEETVKTAFSVQKAIYGKSDLPVLRSILKSGECWRKEDLQIKATDLMELGISGKKIGDTIGALLKIVMEKPELNNKKSLYEIVKNNFGGNFYE